MRRYLLSRRLVPGLVAVLLAPLAIGCSSDADERPEHTGAHGDALAAPTDLAAALMEGGVHLTWRDNSEGETEFMVLRRDGVSAWAAVGTTEADATSFHDGTVVRGNTYTFMVHGMNEAEASAPSNEVTVVIP